MIGPFIRALLSYPSWLALTFSLDKVGSAPTIIRLGLMTSRPSPRLLPRANGSEPSFDIPGPVCRSLYVVHAIFHVCLHLIWVSSSS